MKLFTLFTVFALHSTASALVCPAALLQKLVVWSSVCGQYGNLHSPQTLGGVYNPVAGRNITCRDICVQNKACKSFSYTKSSNACTFYSADVYQMGFVPEKSTSYPVFWSENCFLVPVSCPAASSTSVPILPSKTSSSPVSLSVSSSASKSASTGSSSKSISISITSTGTTSSKTTIPIATAQSVTTSTIGSSVKPSTIPSANTAIAISTAQSASVLTIGSSSKSTSITSKTVSVASIYTTTTSTSIAITIATAQSRTPGSPSISTPVTSTTTSSANSIIVVATTQSSTTVTTGSPSISTPVTSTSTAITSATAQSATTPVVTTSVDGTQSTATSTTFISISSTSISLGTDFTATYTFQEYTLPTFTTGPVSIQGPSSTDVPAVPSPSPICLVNPDDITSTFSVLSSNFSFIIPKNGYMTVIQESDLPSDIEDVGYTPPAYYFQAGSSPGAYDLLVNATGSFLYVGFDTAMGSVITMTASSGSGRNVTSIFSVSCGGQLSINLNSIPYIWQPAANGIDTTISQGTQDKTNTMNALPKTPPAASVAASRRRKRINYEGGAAPRCPNNPPGLVAFVANGARGAESNGCGSGSTASVIPQGSFGSCCNTHDLCYDDCVNGDFEDCNTNFYNCMDNICGQISGRRHPLDYTACYAGRDLYSHVVRGVLGEYAFHEANNFDASIAASNNENTGRCLCECSSGSFCNGNCIQYGSDNQNCGGCGIQCTGANVCRNSQCVCPFNTQTDNNNCGACGIQCPVWAVCNGGQCGCPTATCGNLCVNFQNHPRNCGGCGNVCSSGYCTGGQCVTPPADVCFPGDAITNGGFDSSDADSSWMFNPDNSESGAGFDGGADSGTNSCALDYLGTAVSVFQNISICPLTQYQLTFVARNINVAKTACHWEAHVAGQTIGTGTLTNAKATTWQAIGPLYMAPISSGTGTGTPGSADYTTYQYDQNGIRAYTQLAIIVYCDSHPAISRVDSIAFYPA